MDLLYFEGRENVGDLLLSLATHHANLVDVLMNPIARGISQPIIFRTTRTVIVHACVHVSVVRTSDQHTASCVPA